MQGRERGNEQTRRTKAIAQRGRSPRMQKKSNSWARIMQSFRTTKHMCQVPQRDPSLVSSMTKNKNTSAVPMSFSNSMISLPPKNGSGATRRRTGKAMAELIVDGTAQAVDLAPFDPGRMPRHDPTRLRMRS